MKKLKIIILCLFVVTSVNAHPHLNPSIFHELINHENLLNLLYAFVFLAIAFIIIRGKINHGKKY